MPRDDLGTIRARLADGEHLTADEWRLLMEYDPFAHQIADLALEYLAARTCRKLDEQRRTRKWASSA